MAAQPNYKHYTAEEYLALERKAAYKSEFFNGEIFMMAGASESHNRICFDRLYRSNPLGLICFYAMYMHEW